MFRHISDNANLLHRMEIMNQKSSAELSIMRNDMQYLEQENQKLSSTISALQNDVQYLQQSIKIEGESYRQNLSTLMTKVSHSCTVLQQLVTDEKVVTNHLQNNLSTLQLKMYTFRAFTVQNTQAFSNVPRGQTLVFDSVYTNEGNRYDHHSGVFTGDVAGWYMFLFTIRVRYYNHLCATNLVKNGNRVVIGLSMSGTKYHQHGSESNFAIIHLEIGDKVWLTTGPYDGETCSVDDLSTFSGYLISSF
ncbi:unnamed protein product [Mytilus edulis]|uniref:C1q domain-containing protein n=1 Tax=Mytilus edulis TaxID=6550 RepID=A0A8S3V358_MYTED|nr:unnamed protein product [Mytilus edulis]